MKVYRILSNEWNRKTKPWSGAIGIEELDTEENLEVPAVVAWITRGVDQDFPGKLVDALNQYERENEE